MTRTLPLLIAAALFSTPGLAGGTGFDLPNLTYPTSTVPAPKPCTDAAVLTLVDCAPGR